MTDKESIHPFATVLISDRDASGKEGQTAVVRFDASMGTLVSQYMTELSPGVLQYSGNPSEVTAVLRNLVFRPHENLIDYVDPGQGDVVFDLSIHDGFIATAIEDATTITVVPVNDGPTVTRPIAERIVPENAFSRAILLPSHFEDVDDDAFGGELTWTITSVTTPGLFSSLTVDAGKQYLVLGFAREQSGVSDITVRATDRGGLYAETSFRVTVIGAPVIEMGAGETQPSPAVFIPGSQTGFSRDYLQSFRLKNVGPMTIGAFIVQVSDLHIPVDGIELVVAEYSTGDGGTPEDFSNDATAASGVVILRNSTYEYAVKFDHSLLPGESIVIHLTYQASSVDVLVIRPTIDIDITNPSVMGEAGSITGLVWDGRTGELTLGMIVGAGRSYRLEYSSDLVTWKDWMSPLPISDFNQMIELIDDGQNTEIHPTLSPRRFYRLIDVSTP